MTKVQTFMVGTTTQFQTSLFFDWIQNYANVYLGLGRSEPLWGFGTHAKITHTRTWATSVIGDVTSKAVSPRLDDDKFYDKNTDIIISGGNNTGDEVVYIAYIDKTSTTKDQISSYTFITEGKNGIGNLSLLYMNEHWGMIQGLNSDFMENTLITYNIADYEYYIFNFCKHLDSRTQIEEFDTVTKPAIREPVQLMYSTEVSATEPSTAFDSSIIGDLFRNVTVYGEVYVSGVKPEFITDGAGYIEDNSLTNATFFITDADGVILQTGLSYDAVINALDEISMIFNYPVVGEVVPNSGRLVVQSVGPSDKLSIFYERFSDGSDASDIFPPGMPLDLLKTSAYQSSIMQVLGLKKVPTASMKFARRIVDADDRAYLLAIPSVSSGEIVTCTIADDGESAIEYAVTTDVYDAKNNHFEYVLIDIDITGGVGGDLTEEVYRESFVCVNPLDSAEALLTADDVTHADMFNETKHQYDMGTILYYSRSIPVYRKYLASDEKFIILIGG